MSSNQIRSFSVSTLSTVATDASVATCQAPGLKEINLSHNSLSTIPARLAEFAKNLEILNLAFNEVHCS